jgi:hypothetical protein
MLLSIHPSTEDILITILSKKELSIKVLWGLLQKDYGKKITLQALYRVIKKLTQEGILIKKGTLFTVNTEWSSKVKQLLSSKNTPALTEGESITYSFSSLSSLDAYWKHSVLQLKEMLGAAPILFYNRHVVWLNLKDRKESQKSFLDNFDKEKHYAGFVVGGNTLADKEFRKEFNRKFLQVDLREIKQMPYDSLTVYGGVVLTVKFNNKVTETIEMLYRSNLSIQELDTELEKALERKLKITMTIERNSEKAAKWRNMLSKNFSIPHNAYLI